MDVELDANERDGPTVGIAAGDPRVFGDVQSDHCRISVMGGMWLIS